MAGDWIKMRGSLTTHPKVLRMAKIVATDSEVGRRLSTGFNGPLDEIVIRDVTRDVTIASLLRVWCACNEHTSDGVWRGIEIGDLDQIAGVPGFGAAMECVGWAMPDREKGTITFPNFLEYNAPAKNGGRSSAAERQRKYRERQRLDELKNGEGDVTRDVTRDVTSVTREEKRREEKKKETTSVGFADFWSAYPRKVAKGEAEKAWSKLKPSPGLTTKIVSAVNAAAGCEQWARDGGKFIPHPATWLNGKRWEDEGAPAKINGGQVWDLPNVDPLEIAKGRVFGDAA